jgi:CPA2 family monovalent cation:H+ antiporter-2
MHELAPLIIDLAIILGVASFIAVLFQKIKQPVVLGYLIGGIIIGPYTPPYNLITDTANVKIISELGVIFLMFSLGLEFSFHKLKRVGFAASLTGAFEVVGMLLIGFFTGKLLGWSFYDSLFLGAALSISSTTIIIKALRELGLKKQHFAETIYGVLIVEDLLAILLLVGLSTIVVSHDITITLAWSAIKLVLVVGGWFLVGYLLVPSLMRHIKNYINEETLTLISVALCLFLVCVAAYFDYSTALGAFIMGSILAETTLIHRIEQLTAPIRDIFAAVFFVSVGMLIDPNVLLMYWPSILVICVVTIIAKLFTTGIGSFLSGQRFTDSMRIGFSMAQIGEFSFIIATLGLTLGVISSNLYPIIVAVSVITTFTTPYLIRFSDKASKAMFHSLSLTMQHNINGYTSGVKRILNNPNEQHLYNNTIMRLIINGGIIAIIFILTENFILPMLVELIEPTWIEKGLAWIAAMVLSSPFIWGMLMAFRNPFSHNETMASATAAQHLCWSITAVELAVLSVTYFERWFISASLLIGAAILFKLFYKQLDKSYQWFENHLVSNLQHEAQGEKVQGVIANGELVGLQVAPGSSLVGTAVNCQDLRSQYEINVIAVCHHEKVNLVTHENLHILANDKLVVLGEEDKINIFSEKFKLTRAQV